MKNIIGHFIKYNIAANVVIFSFLFLGILGFRSMKSSFFPLNESRVIGIQIAYPGASPQEMEEGIVLKIEDNLRGLVGVDRFTSTSSENSAQIQVEVLKGYDVDVVLQDIKNAVDRVPSYPKDMEPPVIAKQVFRTEAISFVITGEQISLKTLKERARSIESDLRNIQGISQVEISGFPAEEIEIAINEDKLRAYNLSFAEVANAISSNNILLTGGSVKTEEEEYLIRVSNRRYYAKELDFTILRSDAKGDKIRLKDVALIRDVWNENPDRSYFNGNPSVRIQVSTTNSEDLLSVAELTREYIDKFNGDHSNLSLHITRDASVVVQQRTDLLLKNAGQGMALVFLFLALFLKPRLAFWVAFGLPIAFLGMFVFAPLLGVTINVLSLFGMIIVVGILVDDGIVIAENIYYHYEQGKTAIRAAIDGTLEVVPAITSAILTTIIAFSTFFFLDGRMGEFFSEVSTIVLLTLGISLLEALIILPAHVAHSRALTPDQKAYVFNRYADKGINWIKEKVYGPSLKFFLRNPLLGFSIPVALLLVTMGAISGGKIKVTFFPRIASDRLVVTVRMPQGTNENITDSIASRIEAAAWRVNQDFTKQNPTNKDVIESVIKRIGPGTANATLNINLLPGEERPFPAIVIADALQNETGEIYGAESVEFGSGSNFGGKPVSVSLLGNNIAELKLAKDLLKSKLKENAALKDVSDNDPKGIKEIKITLKDEAYALGFTLSSVVAQVRSGFFGYQVQRFQRGRDEVRVWVRYDRETRSSLKNLDDMRIVSGTGQRIPFREIANYNIIRGEISINHLDGMREIRVDADLKGKEQSATSIMAWVQSDIMPEIQTLYPSVKASYEGQNREAGKVTGSAQGVLPIILFLIYVVIAFTFRSTSQPLLLILMIPFSLIGVGWGHFIHGFPINVLSFLGIIALIGIVVNDGLVLIGKFNANLKRGETYFDALVNAGKSRFRAIFLTSLTTVAGLAPLIFETSRQAQFLIPMAISVAYGIIVATVLTLIMLPLLLQLGNDVKRYGTYLFLIIVKGNRAELPSRESTEQAIKELKVEKYDV